MMHERAPMGTVVPRAAYVLTTVVASATSLAASFPVFPVQAAKACRTNEKVSVLVVRRQDRRGAWSSLHQPSFVG